VVRGVTERDAEESPEPDEEESPEAVAEESPALEREDEVEGGEPDVAVALEVDA
jgi:hypothetical protein